MSYWIVKTNNYNNSKLFHCDYASDINKLPTQTSMGEKQDGDTISSYKCAPGSVCLCLEDGARWILGKDTDSWIKQSEAASGGISYFNDEPDTLTEGMTWIGD